jgi:hypothetical protein
MGMARKQEAAMERHAVEQHKAEQRARMADQAIAGMRDTVREESDRIRQMLYNNGVMRPVDAGGAASSSGPSPQDERNLHKQAMAMLHAHSQQFGAFMEQQRIGQEQMLEVLKGHLRKHQDALDPVIAPVSGGSPPPPPGAGAVASNGRVSTGSMTTGSGVIPVESGDADRRRVQRGLGTSVKHAYGISVTPLAISWMKTKGIQHKCSTWYLVLAYPSEAGVQQLRQGCAPQRWLDEHRLPWPWRLLGIGE